MLATSVLSNSFMRMATVVFLRLTRLFVGHRDTFTAASHKLHESFERASLFASLKGSAPNERSVLSTALKRLVFEPPGRLSKAVRWPKNSTFFTVISETSCREGVPSRFLLELTGASSGDMRLSDHAARSMI
jgi:hypothetical protein